jgi:hypothetical protein
MTPEQEAVFRAHLKRSQAIQERAMTSTTSLAEQNATSILNYSSYQAGLVRAKAKIMAVIAAAEPKVGEKPGGP